MERLSFTSAAVDVFLLISLPVLITIGMGIYQTVRPEKIVSTATPNNFGIEYQVVRLVTADGISVAGWYVPKKGGEGKSSILVLHGYPADKGDLVPRTAFLADRYNLLYIDFRYFGESGGRMTTVGARETAEAAAAVRYLKERGAERIGIYGFSMGAAVGLMSISDLKGDLSAVVAEASYADLRSMAGELFRLMGPMKGAFASLTDIASTLFLRIDLDAVSPAKAVAGSTLPVLLIHSKRDDVIPFENAERIRRGLDGNAAAEYWFPESGRHGESSDTFAERLNAFFGAHL